MIIFDIVLIVLLAGFVFSGLRKGLIRSLGRIIGLIIGAYVASHFYLTFLSGGILMPGLRVMRQALK